MSIQLASVRLVSGGDGVEEKRVVEEVGGPVVGVKDAGGLVGGSVGLVVREGYKFVERWIDGGFGGSADEMWLIHF
jgi:hypothetical protein